MADKPSIITVKGAGDDGKVVLWERNDAHPEGEIFVSNDGKDRKVAETAGVQRKIAAGEMVKVGTVTKTADAKTDSKTDDKK